METFSKYKNRIGAWVTPNPLHALVEKSVEQGELASIASMLSVISKKGAVANLNTFEMLLNNSMNADISLYNDILATASKMLKTDDYNMLLSKFPIKEASSTPIEEESSK